MTTTTMTKTSIYYLVLDTGLVVVIVIGCIRYFSIAAFSSPVSTMWQRHPGTNKACCAEVMLTSSSLVYCKPLVSSTGVRKGKIDAFALAAVDAAICLFPLSHLEPQSLLVTKAKPLQLTSGVHGSASYSFGRLCRVLCRKLCPFLGGWAGHACQRHMQAYAQEGQVQGGLDRCWFAINDFAR